jgi:hypothetical protein
MSRLYFSILLFITASISLSGCTSTSSSGDGTPVTETIAVQTPALAYADIVATNEAAHPDELGSQADEVQASESDSEQSLAPTPKESPVATTTAVAIPKDGSATPILEEENQPPTETPVPTPTASVPFDPNMILGVPVDSIAHLPEEVVLNSREIFNNGRSRGRDIHAFSKLGDSLIANPHFLTGFDSEGYDLGRYDFLQPVVDHFAGSYERYGVAIHAGLHSWGIFDPMWADKNWCQPNESMVACEFRLNNPSILLILLGSNDAGAPDNFAYNLRKLVEFSMENGVIPVLVTKADRFEGPENTNNILTREIAEEYAVPLWDFDLLADMIPDRGLKDDLIHLTPFDEFDYTSPEALGTGHGVHNLTALMVLEAIRSQVMQVE